MSERETFKGKRVSVIGAARSGISAARVLTLLGATVTLSDSQPLDKFDADRLSEIAATGAAFLPGASAAEALPEGTNLVVTSPGVPRTADVLQTAVRHGIPVWSEIELAYRITDAPIVAVTGTNGKTTTTLLIAAMIAAAGKNAVVAGNISADDIKRSLVDAAYEGGSNEKRADGEGNGTILVAEVSSFQLEWVEKFAPHVAVLTNITPDHLNRYADFDDYAQTKARLFAAQKPDDWAIINYDNPAARLIGESGLPARCVWFSSKENEKENEPALFALQKPDLPPTLPGAHSLENVLAAGLAALAMGIPAENIYRAIRDFPGVAHRMEFVADVNGVRYINNSMCTNVAAAVSSLRAMNRPTIVIAGGADKDLEFAPLTPALREKAKQLILIGAAANKMEASFRAGGYDAISRAATLEEAVTMARQMATDGEAVLLSPACASFDMFRDFEARGAAFRQAVRGLTEETQA